MEARPATERDVDQMVDLYEAVAAEGRYIAGEPPIDRDERRRAFLEQIHSPDEAAFVVDDGSRIVGIAGVHGTAPARLGMLVSADRRRTGVGTALLRASIDWARSHGSYKITLELWPHNEAARALYGKFGFEQEGYLRSHYRRRNGEVWDAIIMGLLLDRD